MQHRTSSAEGPGTGRSGSAEPGRESGSASASSGAPAQGELHAGTQIAVRDLDGEVDAAETIAKNVPLSSPARKSAGAVLAELMDFPGGMKVAELLEAGPSSRQRHPEASELGEHLRGDVAARLSAVHVNVMAPLIGRRAPILPTADALYDAYRAAGLEAGHDEATLAKFSELTGEPLMAAVAASMHQAQLHTALLRSEIQDRLRQLGPQAERLERLDAALHVATQVKVRELFERMQASLARTWAAACRHAIAALPGEPTPEDFALWVEPDGWLERFRTRCLGAAEAVYSHLRRNIGELVRAAVFAEES